MKTRGIVNATQRLAGAQRLGSPTLMRKAEEEARHTLTQAKAWLERTPAPPPGESDERYTPVAEAVAVLERSLAAFADAQAGA